MHTVCVIPARFPSQRFPGKPLHPLLGKPMIVWVIEAARRFDFVDEILVATDHEGIAAAAAAAGCEAVMTDPELPSGTDRIHAAMAGRRGDVIINLQGDEPLMPAGAVHAAFHSLIKSGAEVATACVPIRVRESFEAPHIVKVVRGIGDRALYFSRSPIPSLARRTEEDVEKSDGIFGYKHLGLYIYRRDALTAFCSLSPSFLESVEKLEQLRMLENGMRIQCVTSLEDSIGVDLPEDAPRVEELLRQTAGG